MSDEMIINMVTNCAKMEAALELLQRKANAEIQSSNGKYCMLHQHDINEVLAVAGFDPVEMDEAPTAREQ